MPPLVNLEFTKRCNARCVFCKCWQVDSPNELADYSPIIKKMRPVVVAVSGGEPLLRKDYAELFAKMRPFCHYMAVITNGALLNEESAARLANTGVNHISVSLDYLDKRHDEARRIEGLYEHLSEMLPRLASQGYRIILNTVIMDSNLDQIVPIAHKAKEWGVAVSFSSYCPLKKDAGDGMVAKARHAELAGVVREITRLKPILRHIKNSDHYLKRILPYFQGGVMGNCKAGRRWVQVTPDGYVQQCSELPRICHYSEYSFDRLKKVACSKCWYTCRGEAEANPLSPKRLLELIRA